jgi:hypothetical protein
VLVPGRPANTEPPFELLAGELSCWPARLSVACARRWTTLSGRSARVFVSRVIAGASIEHRDAGLASKSGWNHRWSDSRHMNPRVWAADGQLVPVVAAPAPTTEVERAVDTRCRCAYGADGVHHPCHSGIGSG